MKKLISFGMMAWICSASGAGDGRYATWIAFSGLRDEDAIAALNYATSPVVLYDPTAFRDLPDEVLKFSLLREDYVALIAKEMLGEGLISIKRLRAKSSFYLIEEESVYPALSSSTVDGATALDCLAFDALSPLEQARFFGYVRDRIGIDKRFRLSGPEHRLMTRQTLGYLQAPACATFHDQVDAKFIPR